jgi:hypothetical protein
MATVAIPGMIIAVALAALIASGAGAVIVAIGWLTDRWERRADERSPIDSEPRSREWSEVERASRGYAGGVSATAVCVRCRCSKA